MTHSCSVPSVDITLKDGIFLKIFAEKEVEQDSLLRLEQKEVLDYGEEPIQLLEGFGYEFDLPNGFEIRVDSAIIKPSKVSKNHGRLEPNTYVGRLLLIILKNGVFFDEVALEVRSIKADYRTEYRTMLEDITAYSTDLLMMHSSPITQRFTVDHDIPTTTLYQRFAFVKSIVDSNEFRNAIHRIIAMPVTAWKHQTKERDIRRAGKIGSSQLRQIASRNDRMRIQEELTSFSKFESFPKTLTTIQKVD